MCLFRFHFRDVKLNGFTIPKNTQIVPLLHAVHMDPELWENPEAFNPTRFLTPEGKITKPEFFLPFGVGRRMCLGDTLARMELFLFFSNLLHTFRIESPTDQPLPSLKGNAGATITPDSYKVSTSLSILLHIILWRMSLFLWKLSFYFYWYLKISEILSYCATYIIIILQIIY